MGPLFSDDLICPCECDSGPQTWKFVIIYIMVFLLLLTPPPTPFLWGESWLYGIKIECLSGFLIIGCIMGLTGR